MRTVRSPTSISTDGAFATDRTLGHAGGGNGAPVISVAEALTGRDQARTLAGHGTGMGTGRRGLRRPGRDRPVVGGSPGMGRGRRRRPRRGRDPALARPAARPSLRPRPRAEDDQEPSAPRLP